MVSNQFQTEWIAAHLLFPNSAQARDIFLYVTADGLKISANKDRDQIFFKLFLEYLLKIQIVSSSSSFSEFETSKIKLWPTYFKKITKEESAYLVGYVFYKIPINILASLFKCTEVSANHKIQKAMNKIIPKPDSPEKSKYQFHFKKYTSVKNSDFFIYEDIVRNMNDHQLFEKNKIPQQIINNIGYKKYFNHIQDFSDELLGLKLQIYEVPVIQNFKKENLNLNPVFRHKLYKYIPVYFILIGAVLTFLYRPQAIQNFMNKKSIETIEIQQIKIDRHTENKESVANTAVSVEKPPEAIVQVEKKISPPIGVAEKKPIEKNKSGEVYRGRLVVTDLKQVISSIKEKIINLGGKKAGEVDLGWMKNDNTSYFHFSFPDENKTDLEEYLKQFGVFELSNETHPRVMPKGFKRYIIEIKQNE